jgi:sodium transport system permease protein
MPPPALSPPGLWRTALLVARKDLASAYRDRQTWISTVLVPLGLYPLMFFILLQASALVSDQEQARTVRLALGAAPVSAHRLEELALRLEPLLAASGADAGRLAQRALLGAGSDPEDAAPEPPAAHGASELEVLAGLDREALAALVGAQDAAADLPASEPAPASAPDRPRFDAALWLPDDGPPQILFDGARPASLVAEERLSQALERLGRSARQQALDGAGLRASKLTPFRVQKVDLAASTDIGAFVLSMLLPMMLVVMGMLGAFYPAVDLTAGERERGSYETGLIAPIPRLGLAFGKLIAVTLSALLGATMNLVGIGLAANHLLGLMGGAERIDVQIPWLLLALVLPLLLAFLLLVAAVLTAAASLTETFKQGQALLGSVQLVFILPAVAATLPGLELTPGLASVPVVGFTLAVRTVLRSGSPAELPLVPLLCCLLAHLALALLAAALAARLLTRSPDSQSGARALLEVVARIRGKA